MSDTVKLWLIIAAVLALLSLLQVAFGPAEADPYCGMVEIWQRDAEIGVPPEERGGWPPYRGSGECEGLQ